VHGCFWHRCPIHATAPKANRGYWEQKLARNVARDQRNEEALTAAGWQVVVVWEHERVCEAAARVEIALSHRVPVPSSAGSE
jgi:DNA mismatch endonuclease (patch repair protein)